MYHPQTSGIRWHSLGSDSFQFCSLLIQSCSLVPVASSCPSLWFILLPPSCPRADHSLSFSLYSLWSLERHALSFLEYGFTTFNFHWERPSVAQWALTQPIACELPANIVWSRPYYAITSIELNLTCASCRLLFAFLLFFLLLSSCTPSKL